MADQTIIRFAKRSRQLPNRISSPLLLLLVANDFSNVIELRHMDAGSYNVGLAWNPLPYLIIRRAHLHTTSKQITREKDGERNAAYQDVAGPACWKF